MPRLTYIGQTPAEGTGSPVIILRHLQRLTAHGWKITVIGEHGQDTSACERAGWTGDWQIYVETASFLYDVGGFSAKWLRDLAAEQRPDGKVTNLVPESHPGDDRAPTHWPLIEGSGQMMSVSVCSSLRSALRMSYDATPVRRCAISRSRPPGRASAS